MNNRRRLSVRARLSAPVVFIILLAMMLSSCRRDLEVMEVEREGVRLRVDWMSHYGEKPTGMTALFYPVEGGMPYRASSNEVDSVDIGLPVGTYYVRIFNLSEDEFNTMLFTGMGNCHSPAVEAQMFQHHEHAWWNPDLNYMQDPENIGVATDTITVTKTSSGYTLDVDSLKEEDVDFHHHHKGDRGPIEYLDGGVQVFDEVVWPMTTTLTVRANVRGIDNLHAVKAAITGLSKGFPFSDCMRSTVTDLLPLDNWVGTKGDSIDGKNGGWIGAKVSTFGLPYGKEHDWQRDATDCHLYLYCTLTNDSVMKFEFDVGKMIHYSGLDEDAEFCIPDITKPLEILLDTYLDIPDVEHDTPSTFDVDVEKWDQEDVHIWF